MKGSIIAFIVIGAILGGFAISLKKMGLTRQDFEKRGTKQSSEEIAAEIRGAYAKAFKDAGASLKSSLGDLVATLKDTKLEETDKGYKISVQNLAFKADSDELVPEDYERITEIAKALKEIPDRTFLVTGHTAKFGDDPAGDEALSFRRAKAIVAEMQKAGIPAERFLATGAGSAEPIADNGTAEGRAQNRRVEITILTK